MINKNSIIVDSPKKAKKESSVILKKYEQSNR